MMTLGEMQEDFFMDKVPLLVAEIKRLGLRARGGDLFRDPRLHGQLGEQKGYGHKNSCHKLKLAIDVNLVKDGVLLGDGPEHAALHDFWDSLGGAPRIPHDMNHYSVEYRGMR